LLTHSAGRAREHSINRIAGYQVLCIYTPIGLGCVSSPDAPALNLKEVSDIQIYKSQYEDMTESEHQTTLAQD
jgi:hypothetical protein